MTENYIGKCELCGSKNVCEPCAGTQDDGDLTVLIRMGGGKVDTLCAVCDCSLDDSNRGEWIDHCEPCESKVFEFYGATGETSEDIKNKKVKPS